MALIINDRVKETSTTTGTSTITLLGASSDFETFVSQVGATNTTFYSMVNTGQNEFEVGLGTVNADVTYVVTVVNPGSGNKYYLDGSLQNPINLAEGVKYIFQQNDSSVDSHPMKFSTTDGGTHNGGTSYNTGVVYKINGAAVTESAYVSGFAAATTRAIEITVAAAAPTLYTYCHYHAGMGFEATTTGSGTLARTTIISSTNSDSAVNFSSGTKDVFCTVPAKKFVGPGMDATSFVVTHSSTISEEQTMDSGVLAGPVTITATQTITGTLVIV
mgnify:FL=1